MRSTERKHPSRGFADTGSRPVSACCPDLGRRMSKEPTRRRAYKVVWPELRGRGQHPAFPSPPDAKRQARSRFWGITTNRALCYGPPRSIFCLEMRSRSEQCYSMLRSMTGIESLVILCPILFRHPLRCALPMAGRTFWCFLAERRGQRWSHRVGMKRGAAVSPWMRRSSAVFRGMRGSSSTTMIPAF